METLSKTNVAFKCSKCALVLDTEMAVYNHIAHIHRIYPIKVSRAPEEQKISAASNDLYETAKALVVGSKNASTSFVQRKLMIRYSEAMVIIDRMQKDGIISHPNNQGARNVIEST